MERGRESMIPLEQNITGPENLFPIKNGFDLYKK